MKSSRAKFYEEKSRVLWCATGKVKRATKYYYCWLFYGIVAVKKKSIRRRKSTWKRDTPDAFLHSTKLHAIFHQYYGGVYFLIVLLSFHYFSRLKFPRALDRAELNDDAQSWKPISSQLVEWSLSINCLWAPFFPSHYRLSLPLHARIGSLLLLPSLQSAKKADYRKRAETMTTVIAAPTAEAELKNWGEGNPDQDVSPISTNRKRKL